MSKTTKAELVATLADASDKIRDLTAERDNGNARIESLRRDIADCDQKLHSAQMRARRAELTAAKLGAVVANQLLRNEHPELADDLDAYADDPTSVDETSLHVVKWVFPNVKWQLDGFFGADPTEDPFTKSGTGPVIFTAEGGGGGAGVLSDDLDDGGEPPEPVGAPVG